MAHEVQTEDVSFALLGIPSGYQSSLRVEITERVLIPRCHLRNLAALLAVNDDLALGEIRDDQDVGIHLVFADDETLVAVRKKSRLANPPSSRLCDQQQPSVVIAPFTATK